MTPTNAPARSNGRRACTDTPEVLALVYSHRDLAHRLARRYQRSADLADLRQVADLALLLAARRYDPAVGPFDRYAIVTIIGELKKHLRYHGWSARVPRRVQEDAITVQSTIDCLTVGLGRSPRLSELGAASGLPPERVRQALQANSARYATSLAAYDRPHSDDREDIVEDRILVREAMAGLSEIERELIADVYERGLTQREVAQRIGISQSQVQRRLVRALKSLFSVLTPNLEDSSVTAGKPS